MNMVRPALQSFAKPSTIERVFLWAGALMNGSLAERSFRHLVKILRALEREVPQPQTVNFKESFLVRYLEKQPKQILVQKLAHSLAVLHSCEILIEAGQVQSVGALLIVLDDANEDVAFLTIGMTKGEWTQRHTNFCNEFFAEDGVEQDALGLPADKIPRVPRAKINSYIAQNTPGADQSRGSIARKRVFSAYSGFVHGASPNIMDFYDTCLPGFQVTEIKGTSRHADYEDQIFNQRYRTFISFIVALSAFGLSPDDTSSKLLTEFDELNETRTGDRKQKP